MNLAKILVSACLAGQPVRYDGRPKGMPHPLLERWRMEGRLVEICPEMMAGLPAPRPPTEIEPGTTAASVLDGTARVLDRDGGDFTVPFRTGAGVALKVALTAGCRFALLSEGSPSCGSRQVYDGTFQGRRIAGAGVTATLLRHHGITVFSENEIAALAAALTDDGPVSDFPTSGSPPARP